MTDTNCNHEQFAAKVNINRISDVNRFIAEITIECISCHEPFRFMGLLAGLSWDKPTVSIDELELHAPIEPQGTPRIQTTAKFEMPLDESKH